VFKSLVPITIKGVVNHPLDCYGLGMEIKI
jgi:hypothetical protein